MGFTLVNFGIFGIVHFSPIAMDSHLCLRFRHPLFIFASMVIGYHMILTGYGHWLPNDPRGSMSREVFSPDLAPLAEPHFGRKRIQPSRDRLRAFFREAQKQLKYPLLWWEEAERRAIAQAFGEVVWERKLTCYACAILPNHAHLLVRKHRIKAEEMSGALKEKAQVLLREIGFGNGEHPFFSDRSCHVYKSEVSAMRNCVRYIESNCTKHKLPMQTYDFVTPYNDWPLHNKRPS